jgi:hypothetical protein
MVVIKAGIKMAAEKSLINLDWMLEPRKILRRRPSIPDLLKDGALFIWRFSRFTVAAPRMG